VKRGQSKLEISLRPSINLPVFLQASQELGGFAKSWGFGYHRSGAGITPRGALVNPSKKRWSARSSGTACRRLESTAASQHDGRSGQCLASSSWALLAFQMRQSLAPKLAADLYPIGSDIFRMRLKRVGYVYRMGRTGTSALQIARR